MSLRDNPNIIEEVSDIRRDLDELSASLEGGGISGPITTDMIEDGAVTEPKIADGAVASDKLDVGTASAGSGSMRLGDILIQWGEKQAGAYNSNTTVTLPSAFANISYTLILTNSFNESATSFWWAFITGKTTTSFTYRSGWKGATSSGGGGNANNIVNWVAIGKAAS